MGQVDRVAGALADWLLYEVLVELRIKPLSLEDEHEDLGAESLGVEVDHAALVGGQDHLHGVPEGFCLAANSRVSVDKKMSQ